MRRGLFGLPMFVSSAGSSGICRKGLVVGSRSRRAECARVKQELGFPPRAPFGVSWGEAEKLTRSSGCFSLGMLRLGFEVFFFLVVQYFSHGVSFSI